MRNLVKYVGIGLLVMGLAACDNSDTKAPAEGAAAESSASGQPVSLLDGKLSFSLPADMTDQAASWAPGRTICTSILTQPARKR